MDEAEAFARAEVERLFNGRKGHGQGPCTQRRLTKKQLFEILRLAYERGRTHAVIRNVGDE